MHPHAHTYTLWQSEWGYTVNHAENNASSKRQTSHSPYWKISLHCWQCLCPLCIYDPCKWLRESEWGREKEIGRKKRERWEEVRQQQTVKIQQTINPFLFFPLCFPPAGSKQRQKMGLCINFVQTSKNDNKQKEARSICSVRQKQSTKVRSAVAQAWGQKPLCPRERSWWGVREEGRLETGGAKSLRAVQVN